MRRHRASHLGNTGLAVERHRLRQPVYSRAARLRVRTVRQTEIEGVEAARPVASSPRRSFAQLAAGDSIQQPGGSGISLPAPEREQTSIGEHALVRPSSTGGGNNRDRGASASIRVPHLPATLASVLVANNYNPKLVQELLRHSNIKTTLDIYAQAITPAKLEAQGVFLTQLFKVPPKEEKAETMHHVN